MAGVCQCFLFLMVVVSHLWWCGEAMEARRTMRPPPPFSDGLEVDLGRIDSDRSDLKSVTTTEPRRFFEVTIPIRTGKKPSCSIDLLYHSFGNTYGLPPATAQYTPERKCGNDWDLVVLKWAGACKGRQYDRIAAVWLGGVEVLRHCTAEPTVQGVVWEVEKDVTKYASLWKEPQEVLVVIGNVVDKTYTGIINVTLSVEFHKKRHHKDEMVTSEKNLKHKMYSGAPADVILPVKVPSSGTDGYWFRVENEGDVKTTNLQLPRNTYRAVLEVCVSPHEQDEFWYTNAPNDYLIANNLTSELPGNGSFREVVVSIDGRIVGAVWPFAVLYTGGVNPLFWRPASGIGSFNLPTYDIDVTPFVGTLVDGKNHSFSLTVTSALNVWLLDANLHIWIDRRSKQTRGSLLEYSAPPAKTSEISRFHGLDGTFLTTSSRSIRFSGSVESSIGSLTTVSSHSFAFYNSLIYSNDTNLNVVDQFTESESKVVLKNSAKEIAYFRTFSRFPLYLNILTVAYPDASYLFNITLNHAFFQDIESQDISRSSFSNLANVQDSIGYLVILPNNTNYGLGATFQNYSYESTDGCYQRSLGVRNYTFLFDSADDRCSLTI